MSAPRRQTRLGDMLQLYRTVRRRQSLRELAPEIGISAATLARVETGQAFDVDTLLALGRWLLTEDGAAPPVPPTDG